ncbi:MAG: hypothetical protein WDO15_08780 [Bacteroidota bacterium]
MSRSGLYKFDDKYPLTVDMLADTSDSTCLHQKGKRQEGDQGDVEYKNAKGEKDSFTNGN